MQKHVCHIVAGVAEGGLQKHVIDLASHQALSGLEVSVVAPLEVTSALPSNIRALNLRSDRSRHNPLALLELAHALRSLKPDIVHAHAGKAASMTRLAMGIARLRRSALVATIHNQKSSVSPYRRADLVIAVSGSAAKQFRAAKPVVRIIYNGIAPGRARPQSPTPARTSRPLTVAVGRLVEAKGFDLLLDVWRDVDADLWLVGDGPERDDLLQIRKRHALEDRVYLLGRRADAPGVLGLADLVVIPSRREGFSYVMAEALHARRPIVATRVPGPVDILPECFLASIGDRDEIRDKVSSSLANLPAAHEIYESIWRFARDELTIERMTCKTIEAYAEALATSS